ncbi:MAG: hypothetical protein ABIA75_08705, partial [Candidatus Neomarinimicrobiota bacterium]
FGIVDIVSWNTVDTEIEELLFNLPIRQFSKPLEFNGEYHVFRVVETERNILTRDNDFRTQQESLRGVLRKRWERVAAAEFVEQCLADQNLIIKADPLNRLTEYIWANRPVDTNREIQFITNEEINFITQSLADLAETPIAVFTDGQFTVDEILFNYKINPFKLNYDSIPELRENLKNIVAIYVRDWVLSEKGIREKLDRRPAVIEEEQSRREQLLAEKMLRKFAGELDLDKHEIAEQNKIFNNYMSDYVARLKAEADLEVFESNLLAVSTSDAGLSRKIDFLAVHTQ